MGVGEAASRLPTVSGSFNAVKSQEWTSATSPCPRLQMLHALLFLTRFACPPVGGETSSWTTGSTSFSTTGSRILSTTRTGACYLVVLACVRAGVPYGARVSGRLVGGEIRRDARKGVPYGGCGVPYGGECDLVQDPEVDHDLDEGVVDLAGVDPEVDDAVDLDVGPDDVEVDLLDDDRAVGFGVIEILGKVYRTRGPLWGRYRLVADGLVGGGFVEARGDPYGDDADPGADPDDGDLDINYGSADLEVGDDGVSILGLIARLVTILTTALSILTLAISVLLMALSNLLTNTAACQTSTASVPIGGPSSLSSLAHVKPIPDIGSLARVPHRGPLRTRPEQPRSQSTRSNLVLVH
ncbi:hypothetical protein BDK51DRAFT_43620 [Blyttiomyces helicus]|uniref:Uncharacterized protein n=1 Tax=Blyttiomyces helicus TaxID=388810 RepID=A0A4P9W884_9FUNG|nr:hypothetical protein BDK51DRAFT_43620 [Blyttiomyces helicus]|eukprot:RKO88731.1 hypothetical protein BDK51DRAFT_43620 [Blyttiomyces helicus]